jgi:hypothetical protein
VGLHLLQLDGCQVLISLKKKNLLGGDDVDHFAVISVVTARLHVHEPVLSYTERRLYLSLYIFV